MSKRLKEYSVKSEQSLYANSSGGQLLKWKIGNEYIKTSTLDKQSLATSFMYGSYAEVIAYHIAKIMQYKCVKYELCKITIDNSIQTIGCVSKEFKRSGYREYSIGKLILLGKIPKMYYGDSRNYNVICDSVKWLGLDIKEHLDSIIILDSILLNDDRHYGNFGILANYDGQIEEIPIFDNGNSLFCHKHTEELEYSTELIRYLRCKPFDIDFNSQLRLVSSKRVKIASIKRLEYLYKEVNKMEFLEKFIGHGLPEERIRFIRNLLLDRIRTVYNILEQ